ncbi:OTU domain-containing protein 5-A [Seminavis robusta]|uniref:OTU domain-containing protein 5-A n=1 Tax=Seminavis robusta TaxID=568900 RepID=A0A9N8HN83_9STRA|nr:OTU domain-containing protein 5-A [Seminavis robusta]|eukprot:Sro801_g204460.1 OTU domain-containing protein 5-A (340) ;mRNA; f:17132-18151
MGRKGKGSSKKGGKQRKSHDDSTDSTGPSDPPSRNKRHKNKQKEPTTSEDDEFRASLQASGQYSILEIDADGNCLFRSLSDQLFHDLGKRYYQDVRHAVCDFIEHHKDDFSVFLVLDDDDCKDEEDAEDFESYVEQMRQDGEWGGNLELVAAARLYRRNITVFSGQHSMNIPHGLTDTSDNEGEDLLLSYHDNDHYSSVHDLTKRHKIAPLAPPAHSLSNEAAPRKRKSGKKANNKKEPPEEKKEMDEQRPPPLEPEGKRADDDGSVIAAATPPSSKPTRKNATCPCGSGKKYKKCCWAQERHKQRIQKNKRQQEDEQEEEEEVEVVHEMNGNFRVLHI